MSTKKKVARATKKAGAKPAAAKRKKNTKSKAGTPKTAKAPRQKVDRSDWVTFALRLPKGDATAFHAAAGPGRGSEVGRQLMAAFTSADESAFRAAVKEAREARG